MFPGNIKCFRWRDGSFVIDPDVRTSQDVIDSTKVRRFVSLWVRLISKFAEM